MNIKNLVEKSEDLGTVDDDLASASVNVIGGKWISCQAVITNSSAPGSASVILQKSNDGTNWVSQGSATTVSGDGNFFLDVTDPEGAYYRAFAAIASGSFDCNLNWLVKGLDG